MYTWTISEPVTRLMFSTVRETASLVNLLYDKPWLQQIESHVRRIELETLKLTRKQKGEQSSDADVVHIPDSDNHFMNYDSLISKQEFLTHHV